MVVHDDNADLVGRRQPPSGRVTPTLDQHGRAAPGPLMMVSAPPISAARLRIDVEPEVAGTRLGRVEPAAVVGDLERHPARAANDVDPGLARTCVLDTFASASRATA